MVDGQYAASSGRNVYVGSPEIVKQAAVTNGAIPVQHMWESSLSLSLSRRAHFTIVIKTTLNYLY